MESLRHRSRRILTERIERFEATPKVAVPWRAARDKSHDPALRGPFGPFIPQGQKDQGSVISHEALIFLVEISGIEPRTSGIVQGRVGRTKLEVL